MKKIITHDGFFHADEIFAIALLHQVLGECPVERRRTISQEEFQDPDIWILDVGRRHEQDLHNLDHHHNPDSHSTNMLVLQVLLNDRVISEEQSMELMDSFCAISDIDRNGYAQANGFQVNSLIRAFNNIENGFNFALQVAGAYIRAAFDTVTHIATSRMIWNSGVVFHTILRVCKAYPIHWKRYKEEPFLIYPENDTWKLVSIDSEKYPLVSTGKETFLHNASFLAVFTTKLDAITCALESIEVCKS